MKHLKRFNEITGFDDYGWTQEDFKDIWNLFQVYSDEYDIHEKPTFGIWEGIAWSFTFNTQHQKCILKFEWRYYNKENEKMLDELSVKMSQEFIPRLYVMGYKGLIVDDSSPNKIHIEITKS